MGSSAHEDEPLVDPYDNLTRSSALGLSGPGPGSSQIDAAAVAPALTDPIAEAAAKEVLPREFLAKLPWPLAAIDSSAGPPPPLSRATAEAW